MILWLAYFAAILSGDIAVACLILAHMLWQWGRVAV